MCKTPKLFLGDEKTQYVKLGEDFKMQKVFFKYFFSVSNRKSGSELKIAGFVCNIPIIVKHIN